MFYLCITWGFDDLAGSIAVSIPEFRRDFGRSYGGDYVVDADWQLGFTAASMFGIIVGGLLSGPAISRLGRRPVIFAAYLLTIGGTAAQVVAVKPAHFLAGKLVAALPLGLFTAAAPPYASEMAPLAVRGAVTAGVNFAIVLGQLVGYGVARQTQRTYEGTAASYRVLFATQWGFAAVGLALLPWFPE
jgi:MFS family permease